ncbi:Tm-1-like ATP-binding domain-containing protein [Rhodopirellula sp. JC740]|uniref:Tm-1-like ATP-binding domain-containing protein n=1 Tax=Rhodopirellula halodulae TaxID=2894198 RepID=A0ABS8NFW5_9BACT|nr:Tm-1-like ATP-binding domain-containing protein [Rhodopirellula sp. JC740]MCC9642432.1 Tm-1-like ATP-binding domain-containing protein [Rhodopirellula sp. JC740]
MANIAVIGTLDSKGIEHQFVADQIRKRGHTTLLIDVGTGGPPQVAPDVSRQEVAEAGGICLDDLMSRQDRGECVSAMADTIPRLMRQLLDQGRIDGVISLGGGGGTAIGTAAMRALPIGFPKVMVSTMASGNIEHYVGTKDIVIIPSVVDVAGLNRVSRTIFTRAAGAICGMVESQVEPNRDDRPLIVASMFGNTTQCVNAAVPILEAAGYEVLIFHSTGAGGKAMESLIESGMIAGVLDITTTEWADELLGGVMTAGPHRLEAAGRANVPSIVVPGCLDMVNFGARDTVPDKFSGRNIYIHNPQVTLMRTSPEECRELGSILANKINQYTAPVSVLIPQQAVSGISAKGGPYHDPEADQALFSSLTGSLRGDVDVRLADNEINDEAFARLCAETLLENIRLHQASS